MAEKNTVADRCLFSIIKFKKLKIKKYVSPLCIIQTNTEKKEPAKKLNKKPKVQKKMKLINSKK